MRTCGLPHELFTFMIEYVDGGYISHNIYVGALYTNLPLFHIFSTLTLFLDMVMYSMEFKISTLSM
jgi:hypothetical protein